MEITLFELHFDGETSFGPTFGGDEDEETSEPGSTDGVDLEFDDDESSGLPGPSPVAVLAALVVLALVGLGVKRALGGDDDAETDEYEPEMVEIEE